MNLPTLQGSLLVGMFKDYFLYCFEQREILTSAICRGQVAEVSSYWLSLERKNKSRV